MQGLGRKVSKRKERRKKGRKGKEECVRVSSSYCVARLHSKTGKVTCPFHRVRVEGTWAGRDGHLSSPPQAASG
jgi:hypothetical protein